MELADRLAPVHVRQAQVHEHEVGEVLGGQLECFPGRCRLDDLEAVCCEHVACELQVASVVVDDQHERCRRIVHPCRSGSCLPTTTISSAREYDGCSSWSPSSKWPPCAVTSSRCCRRSRRCGR